MVALFYVCDVHLLIKLLATAAAKDGPAKSIVAEDAVTGFSVDRAQRVLWNAHRMGPSDCEDDDFRCISSVPTTIWCISHHPHERTPRIATLRNNLEDYGGFVGNDEECFEPRFTLKDIDQFTYRSDDDRQSSEDA